MIYQTSNYVHATFDLCYVTILVVSTKIFLAIHITPLGNVGNVSINTIYKTGSIAALTGFQPPNCLLYILTECDCADQIKAFHLFAALNQHVHVAGGTHI